MAFRGIPPAALQFQISADGLLVGSGYYAMAKDQLERFRQAVDDDQTGAEIQDIVIGLASRFSIGAVDELKVAPRGYPATIPVSSCSGAGG